MGRSYLSWCDLSHHDEPQIDVVGTTRFTRVLRGHPVAHSINVQEARVLNLSRTPVSRPAVHANIYAYNLFTAYPLGSDRVLFVGGDPAIAVVCKP